MLSSARLKFSLVIYNSRVTATKARKILSWNPTGASLLREIESGYYYRQYAR